MKRFLIVLAALLICSAPVLFAQTDQRAQLAKEIEKLDRQIAANSSKSASATTKLKLTQKKVEATRNLVKESNNEIAKFNVSITEVEKSIENTQQQLDTSLFYYQKLIKAAYLNRDTKMWTMYILGGENLPQDIRRYNYLKSLSSSLHDQSQRILSKKRELENQKKELVAFRSASSRILASRDRELKKLKAEEAAERQLIDEIKRNTTKYKNQLAQKQKQMTALDAKVQGMVSSKGKKVYSAAEKKLSGEFVSNKGKLPWPVDGVVVEQFGEHPHPVIKNVKVKSKGVNIATGAATPVLAIFSGVVSNVVIMPGYNQCVLIQHGQYYSFYCGLKDVKVKAGQKVDGGTQLGIVDTINGNTELHFQIWDGTTVQNPEKWLLP